MIIKNARSALISNYEVFNLLNERIEYQKEVQTTRPNVEYPEHLRTIQFELAEYLKTTPTKSQTTVQVKDFLQQMNQYALTLGEKLQILNLRPKSAVEIYLLIEECEERFNEQDLDNILSIIITTLPHEEENEEEFVENE
ncbi:HRDC-like protein [Absidia repens]|uniref:DNA-directed RNA polymerase III subunit RPC9 n=1 Tax=Absidia repens TaxID=90262 RepID=A0A1X2IHY4_9FUNG|nr:HRDC-like protein [Absidia repens]